MRRKKYPTKISKDGFTLIELLVVISIVGLLASTVLVAVNNAAMKSRDARRIADINQISKALELYYADNGRYPTGTYDSRYIVNPGVPPWEPLMTQLVPKYMSRSAYPPRNNKQDGAMCSNCDEYIYSGKANGTGAGYSMCTYVAIESNKTGSNGWGPFYCVAHGCGPGYELAWCP